MEISRDEGWELKIQKKSLSGTRSRLIVSKLKHVVEVVFSEEFDETNVDKQTARSSNEAKHALWIELLDAYVPMMEACRQRHDLTDEEIDKFHVLSQRFMRLYVDLFGGNDITNYIHMFGSGQVTYYLRKHRNL